VLFRLLRLFPSTPVEVSSVWAGREVVVVESPGSIKVKVRVVKVKMRVRAKVG
jgi:hypothetical protein